MLEVIAESNAVRWYERGGWELVDERWSDWRARDGHRRTVRVYLEPHIS
jgi:Holliday junction resolvase-like predicted endonuclease